MTAILGGGMSGLSAGYYLLKQGVKPITIYEVTGRVGGWIRSERNEDKGFIFERGPRTIRPKGPAGVNTLDLIEELGLGNEIRPILSNHIAAKNRMIYAKDQLCLLPNDISGIIRTIPPFTKPLMMAGMKDLFKGEKTKLDDESIYNFVNRRFGREVADYAISAMICGICAGDAKEISVKFLMEEIFKKEQKYGGIIKGLIMDSIFNRKERREKTKLPKGDLAKRAVRENWSIYTLNGGLESLPRRLGEDLQKKNVEIVFNDRFEDVEFTKNKVLLRINGTEKIFDNLIISIPSYKTSELVFRQHPILANEMKEIPFVDVCVINLQYNKPNIQKHQGFGFLVPPIENLPILGVIFDSCCFDMGENTVLTVMMGGKWFKKFFGQNPTEEHLLDVAVKHVNQILKIDQPPDTFKVNVLRNCIPQYVIGHHDRVKRIRQYIKEHKLPLGLCGASYDGVGVNDVIMSAKMAAINVKLC